MTPPGQAVGFLIAVGVALLILLLRNRRPRKLRIELLWIRPLIFCALLVTVAIAAPPALTPPSIALMIGALAIGAALGWQRGRFMRIEVDPETHALTSRASPVGVIFILALLALRLAVRGMVLLDLATLPISAVTATDALLVLAVAMMVVQGVEMWLRARRLLAESQAAKVVQPGREANPPIVG